MVSGGGALPLVLVSLWRFAFDNDRVGFKEWTTWLDVKVRSSRSVVTCCSRAGVSSHLLGRSVFICLQQAAVNPAAGGEETRVVQSVKTEGPYEGLLVPWREEREGVGMTATDSNMTCDGKSCVRNWTNYVMNKSSFTGITEEEVWSVKTGVYDGRRMSLQMMNCFWQLKKRMATLYLEVIF